MGSPSSRLTIPEHLRPWVDAGLEYLLRPVADADQDVVNDHVEETPQQNQEKITAPVQEKLKLVQPQQAPQIACTGYKSLSDEYAKRIPESAKIIFTYPELTLDLQGKGDPARGETLRNILGHLSWPKGTTGFLPMCDCEGKVNAGNSPIFWKHILSAKVLYVVCFGYDGAKGLYPALQPNQSFVSGRNSILYVMPTLEHLNSLPQIDMELALLPLRSLPL